MLAMILLASYVGLAATHSPHLANLFTSLSEPVDNATMPITMGKIPEWLCAVKYNNGFGKYEGDSGFAFKYLFDVMSFVAKWRVCNGTVTFATQLIQSKYLATSAKETPLFRTFGGVMPPMTEWQKVCK